MKKWNAAAIEELNIQDTAYGWLGIYQDGGRFGDGQISGHLSWTPQKPSDSTTQTPTPTPTPDAGTGSEDTKGDDTNALS